MNLFRLIKFLIVLYVILNSFLFSISKAVETEGLDKFGLNPGIEVFLSNTQMSRSIFDKSFKNLDIIIRKNINSYSFIEYKNLIDWLEEEANETEIFSNTVFVEYEFYGKNIVYLIEEYFNYVSLKFRELLNFVKSRYDIFS